ncbi:MAG: hypothetical protein A2177_06990 [Spirochaetes bacterium RBG_13_68_11]|nr:MAG: hypothetical protein A2177_06990 [Spirochaetes bacterium RBG_13_68_11]
MQGGMYDSLAKPPAHFQRALGGIDRIHADGKVRPVVFEWPNGHEHEGTAGLLIVELPWPQSFHADLSLSLSHCRAHSASILTAITS